MTRRACRDSGSATLEAAILTPVWIMLLALVVLVGRIQEARLHVEGAARSAARAVTLERDLTAPTDVARVEAEAGLDVGGATCRELAVAATPSPGEVLVTVTCSVDLQAAGILPIGGFVTVTGEATEVFDEFREQGP